jgi:hypothetical protein
MTLYCAVVPIQTLLYLRVFHTNGIINLPIDNPIQELIDVVRGTKMVISTSYRHLSIDRKQPIKTLLDENNQFTYPFSIYLDERIMMPVRMHSDADEHVSWCDRAYQRYIRAHPKAFAVGQYVAVMYHDPVPRAYPSFQEMSAEMRKMDRPWWYTFTDE